MASIAELAKKINDLVRKGDTILEKISEDIESKKNNEWFITKLKMRTNIVMKNNL